MATDGTSTSKSAINDMLADVRKAAAQVKESKAKGEGVIEAEARLQEAVSALARERDAMQAPEDPPEEANPELSEDQEEWLQTVKRLVERQKRNKTGRRGEPCRKKTMKAPRAFKEEEGDE
ncbi:hypothetical protein CEP52_005906 [Fusarium oligoseptatum]|uniref:Uncharacterized protein n=1 Tax=Fusarium oligoseptatum TaxID=2604345 RepID=A0A428TVJ4_9HYPO|nr:hypothetical protein CEP52_005906 [Fusarium oligoseptatum]